MRKNGIDFKKRFDLKKFIMDLNENDSKENKNMEALPAPSKSDLSFNSEDLQSRNINNMSFSFLWENSENKDELTFTSKDLKSNFVDKNELKFTSEDLKSNVEMGKNNLSFSFLWQDSKIVKTKMN